MKRITRSAIVEHSASQMYDLVQDIESYPRFLPWCIETEVLERSVSSTTARLSVGMRGGLRHTFTTQNANHPGEGIRLRLVEGPFKRFGASWRFSPLRGHACRIEYHMEYEFSSALLAKVLEPLFDRIADTMVDAFVRRADEVYGAHR